MVTAKAIEEFLGLLDEAPAALASARHLPDRAPFDRACAVNMAVSAVIIRQQRQEIADLRAELAIIRGEVALPEFVRDLK